MYFRTDDFKLVLLPTNFFKGKQLKKRKTLENIASDFIQIQLCARN